MKKTETKQSAGLAFMQAARSAMPRTLGDRERVSAMDGAMHLAVSNRFFFKPDDAMELKRLGIETTVGVFRPLDENYYRLACKVGGTYPRVWEQVNGIKPWRAARAFFGSAWRTLDMQENARICTQIPLLMPADFTGVEPGLAAHQGLQVWWCTDFTAESINLCRYRPGLREPNANFTQPGGAPARRRKLTRAEWERYQAQLSHEGEPILEAQAV